MAEHSKFFGLVLRLLKLLLFINTIERLVMLANGCMVYKVKMKLPNHLNSILDIYAIVTMKYLFVSNFSGLLFCLSLSMCVLVVLKLIES